AQRPTPNAQCRTQTLLFRYWTFGVGRSAFSSSQLLLHFRTQRLSIRASRGFGLERFHHRAHLRLRGGADLRDRFPNQCRKFLGAQPLRQIGVENFHLFLLLRRELGPPPFFEALDRILALFHLLPDHLGSRRIVQGAVRLFDRGVFERRF